jgi:hypothetical protein
MTNVGEDMEKLELSYIDVGNLKGLSYCGKVLQFLKKLNIARHQWLTSIILATQEAEIRRIAVQSQPGQIVHETLSQKYPTQKRVSRVAQVVEQLPTKHVNPIHQNKIKLNTELPYDLAIPLLVYTPKN